MKYIENDDTAPGDERAFNPSEVDDLGLEIEQIPNNRELLAFLAERSREKETFGLDDVKRKLGL
jgi:hypothetical protein